MSKSKNIENPRNEDKRNQPEGVPSSQARPKALLLWVWVIALFAGAFLAYAPVLSGEPIWDDLYLVGSNPFFRSPIFALEVFRHWLFIDSLSTYYRPVQNLTYQADYLIWQGNTFGYHFTNILLHGGASALLFLLLRRLLPNYLSAAPSQSCSHHSEKARWIAFGVAAIWVVHPIHNAAVAYMAGRADSLAAVFALGGWLLFLRSEEKDGIARAGGFIAAWAAGLMALCSKEIAITWMVLFAAVHLTGTLRRKVSILGTLGLLLACYWFLHHLPEPRPYVTTAHPPFEERILLMLRALGDYTGLIFWPGHLQMGRIVFTPKAYATSGAWQTYVGYEYLSLLGAGTLALLAFGLRGNVPGLRLRRLGALWFLIGFLPVSNLFPLNAQVAEHWIYMPSIGYFLFLAGCFLALPIRWQTPVTALIAVALVAFTVRSRIRSEDWSSPERFFKGIVENRIEDPRLLVNLATLHMDRGDLAGAEKMLRHILAEWPDYGPANFQLGNVLAAQGHKEAAEPVLRTVETSSTSWKAQAKLAEIADSQGKLDAAMKIVDLALRSKPTADDLIQLKIHYLIVAGRTAEALSVARHHAQEVWWSPLAQELLAKICYNNGEPDEAIDALRRSAWLDIWASKPLMMATQIEESRNRHAAALEFAKLAVWRDPGPSQYLLLASVCRKLGHDSEAIAAFHNFEELRLSGTSDVTR